MKELKELKVFDSLILQVFPIQPGAHEHWNELILSEHVPPFSHGLEAHSFTSAEIIMNFVYLNTVLGTPRQ